MIKFFHITSLEAAISILRSGTFHPVQGMQSDAGLNGFECDRPRWTNQYFGGEGAALHLEWSGPVQVGDGYTPNILFDQMPHRLFVPAGTDKHLHLTGLAVEPEAWGEFDVHLPLYIFGETRRARARHKAIVAVQAKTESLIKMRPKISVDYPRERLRAMRRK